MRCGVLSGAYNFGTMADMCSGEVGLKIIDGLYFLLVFGAVGNPIITLITQNTYCNRLILLWSSCVQNCPQMCRLALFLCDSNAI